MNWRLILGVGLPGLALVVLAAISAFNPGFEARDDVVPTLAKEVLFPKDYSGTNIKVLTQTLTNNFFLPRAQTLPAWHVCVAKGDMVATQGFSYVYTSGPADRQGSLDRELFTPDTTTAKVSVGAWSTKTVYLYVQTQYRGSFGGYYDKPIPARREDGTEVPAEWPVPDFDALLLIPAPDRNVPAYMSYSECTGVAAQQAKYRIPLT